MIVTFQYVYCLLKEIVKALLFTVEEEDLAENLSDEHPVDVGPKVHVIDAQGEKVVSVWATFRRRTTTTCSSREKLSFTFGSRLHV